MAAVPCTGPNRFRGFTLMELIAVILIAGLLAFSVVPRFMDRGAVDARAKAEQLAGDIRYTQALAMSSGQRNRINFTATSYQITTGTGGPVAHPATGSTAAVPLGNVALSGHNVAPLNNSYLAFNGKGVPLSDVAGSGTALAATATLTLSAGGSSRQILVSPQTGRVAVQ